LDLVAVENVENGFCPTSLAIGRKFENRAVIEGPSACCGSVEISRSVEMQSK
jgi:hypothetical protein